MFYPGSLQSGISHAIQTSKTVVCFVTSPATTTTTSSSSPPESQVWEREWLRGEDVAEVLAAKAVTLRIEEGSQEAGFLAAFAPVEGVVPVLVFIRDGRVLDVLRSGIGREEFVERVERVLGGMDDGNRGTAETAAVSSTTTTTRMDEPPDMAEDTVHSVAETTVSAPAATTQNLHDERTARPKAKGKEKEVAAPSSNSTASSDPANPPAARNDYLEQQRRRQIEARRERERVMAQIEADKAERRARREQDRQARETASSQVQQDQISTSQTTTAKGARSRSNTSNLQVRLLDGSTVRKQFPATATLEADIRPWIDENLGDTAAPYTFKHILAPQPARSISVSEEQQPLLELDLTPSATLVLQTIDSYSDAYTSASPGGLFNLPYNAVSGAYDLVSGTVGSAARWLRGGLYNPPDGHDGMGGQVLGNTNTASASPSHPTTGDVQAGADDGGDETSGPAAAAGSQRRTAGAPRSGGGGGGVRIRTLADQRDGAGDQQFYNGNSLDFQPRNQ